MERRVGLRARTDFQVITTSGMSTSHCRGVEISPSGIVLDRGRLVDLTRIPLVLGLELRLPERLRSIRTLARPVWARGQLQALKFVKLSDVDRLTLAEHLDLMQLRGALLN